MEEGFVNVGGNRVDGEAGIIFLGNIDVNDMDAGKDMFRELPDIFRDSALLQRAGLISMDRSVVIFWWI